ncbi:hypothetical protein [Frateuria sp. YIM B11624]|uniref:hypothetical protein n=1 Tax=Frateuria sp. YIM B11624 TaxID=3143185 RepID=UPI003C7233F7
MQNRWLGILLALAVAWPLAGAAAIRDGAQHFPRFEQLDANHDGLLSRSELPNSLQDMRAHFSQYAYVGGRISQDTYARYVAYANVPDGVWVTLAESGTRDP